MAAGLDRVCHYLESDLGVVVTPLHLPELASPLELFSHLAAQEPGGPQSQNLLRIRFYIIHWL